MLEQQPERWRALVRSAIGTNVAAPRDRARLRREPYEGNAMHQTIVCPSCRVTTVLRHTSDGAPGEAACEHCGAPFPQDSPTPVRPLTVLCVDDDPLVLHFYKSFLTPRGYRTLTAPEGLQGMPVAHRDRPDVILLDVLLRGLSGYDICRKLRADPALRDIPVILLTAWEHPSVLETGRAAGATLTLRKPVDPETILTSLAQVLHNASRPPEG